MSTEKGEGGKVEKQHAALMQKLVALVGDEKKLKLAKRIPKDDTARLIAELFEEDHKLLHEDAKKQLRETLKKYAEMQTQFIQKEQEIAKLKMEKKKEFNKVVSDLLNKFESTDQKIAQYAEGLKGVADSQDDSSEDSDTENETAEG